jgi:ABC-type oligopeptide transport system ATPase subunit
MSPTDRRALIIVPTISNEDEIRSMLGEVQPAMLKVVSALDATSAETIINFLDEMQSAVDSVRP